MSRKLVDLTNKELIEYFIFVIRETVKDENERMVLENRFGIDLHMEDVFADLEKTRKELDVWLKAHA